MRFLFVVCIVASANCTHQVWARHSAPGTLKVFFFRPQLPLASQRTTVFQSLGKVLDSLSSCTEAWRILSGLFPGVGGKSGFQASVSSQRHWHQCAKVAVSTTCWSLDNLLPVRRPRRQPLSCPKIHTSRTTKVTCRDDQDRSATSEMKHF